MAPVTTRSALFCLLGATALMTASCSPEARRHRDGGPGADPGNRRYVEVPPANPKAADTTLWPGKAKTPVEQLAAGTMRPPPAPAPVAPAAPVA
ncbi:MAG: hypothetical protein ABJD11_15440, partial [Gemmatimonadota bacterium]